MLLVSDYLKPHGLYSPWNSPGQNTGVGSRSLLQGIFPTQGLNPGLLCCRRILYYLSHQESLKKYHQIRFKCMSSIAVPISSRNTTYFASLVVPCQIHQGCVLSPCLFSLYAEVSSVQSLSHVRLFVTPRITARQVSLSITKSQSLLRLMSIKLVMPSSHLIFCRPLLFLPPIPLSIKIFSNESALHMRWSKYWSFSFSISLSNEHPGLISFRMDWLDLLASPRDSQESYPVPQFKSIFFAQLSL